jgi:hypothetical protein
MTNKDEAHSVYEEVKKFRYMSNYSYIQLGELLLRIQREKLYKAMDHRTYGSFLSDPEIAIPRATAYLYTLIYKFYVEKMGLDPNDLMEVDITRLREIMGGCTDEESTQEWLAKAKTLGRKDFINAVRTAKGLPEMPPKGTEPGPDEPVAVTYLELVKSSPCIICGKTPVDPHHFPQTSVRTDDDRKVIPLCREHHDYAGHAGVDTFISENSKAIFDWFYGLVLEPRG